MIDTDIERYRYRLSPLLELFVTLWANPATSGLRALHAVLGVWGGWAVIAVCFLKLLSHG